MGATAELELAELLAGMEPKVDSREFVYCCIDSAALGKLTVDPIGTFREEEDHTLILLRSQAEENNLLFTFRCRKITLHVHSSLYAIGFLAAIATRLAKSGISSNCVSAYHHDHLFVPAEEGERALLVLRELQQASINARLAGRSAGPPIL